MALPTQTCHPLSMCLTYASDWNQHTAKCDKTWGTNWIGRKTSTTRRSMANHLQQVTGCGFIHQWFPGGSPESFTVLGLDHTGWFGVLQKQLIGFRMSAFLGAGLWCTLIALNPVPRTYDFLMLSLPPIKPLLHLHPLLHHLVQTLFSFRQPTLLLPAILAAYVKRQTIYAIDKKSETDSFVEGEQCNIVLCPIIL